MSEPEEADGCQQKPSFTSLASGHDGLHQAPTSSPSSRAGCESQEPTLQQLTSHQSKLAEVDSITSRERGQGPTGFEGALIKRAGVQLRPLLTTFSPTLPPGVLV